MAEEAYFSAMAYALKQAGHHRPCLVLDIDRLDENIETIRKGAGLNAGLRVVDKSLPSLPLLAHILERLQTTRIMSFDLSVTRSVLSAFPQVEILFGKPMPIEAVRVLFRNMTASEAADFAARTVLLADSADRIRQLAALAAEGRGRLRIAIEVDVGMHRGGVADPGELSAVAGEVLASGHLQLEGIMAYEAHIPAIPGFAGGPAGEAARVRARLAAFVAALPEGGRRIVNTGGSKTVLGYADPGVANDLSVGSAFVMPTDFDLPALAALKPAIFIAAPVLKVVDAKLPGPAWLTRVFQAVGAFPRKGCFLFGGHWLAKPVYPQGMRASRLWGPSSNQQFMALADDCRIGQDDFAFFRPTQSEAVLWQFGAIKLFAGGRITGEWPVIVP